MFMAFSNTAETVVKTTCFNLYQHLLHFAQNFVAAANLFEMFTEIYVYKTLLGFLQQNPLCLFKTKFEFISSQLKTTLIQDYVDIFIWHCRQQFVISL